MDTTCKQHAQKTWENTGFLELLEHDRKATRANTKENTRFLKRWKQHGPRMKATGTKSSESTGFLDLLERDMNATRAKTW